MSLGGTPQEAGLVKGFVDVAQRGRRQAVDVFGEGSTLPLVPNDRRDPGRFQDPVGVRRRITQYLQRRAALVVDVAPHELGEAGQHLIGRRRCRIFDTTHPVF